MFDGTSVGRSGSDSERMSNPHENAAARRVEKRNTGPAMVSMVTHTVDFPGKRLIQYSFGRRARRIYMQTYNACRSNDEQ